MAAVLRVPGCALQPGTRSTVPWRGKAVFRALASASSQGRALRFPGGAGWSFGSLAAASSQERALGLVLACAVFRVPGCSLQPVTYSTVRRRFLRFLGSLTALSSQGHGLRSTGGPLGPWLLPAARAYSAVSRLSAAGFSSPWLVSSAKDASYHSQAVRGSPATCGGFSGETLRFAFAGTVFRVPDCSPRPGTSITVLRRFFGSPSRFLAFLAVFGLLLFASEDRFTVCRLFLAIFDVPGSSTHPGTGFMVSRLFLPDFWVSGSFVNVI